MHQESNTTWTEYSPSSHRLSSVLRRYAPISLVIVTGLMLTAVILSMVESSEWGVVAAGISLRASLRCIWFFCLGAKLK